MGPIGSIASIPPIIPIPPISPCSLPDRRRSRYSQDDIVSRMLPESTFVGDYRIMTSRKRCNCEDACGVEPEAGAGHLNRRDFIHTAVAVGGVGCLAAAPSMAQSARPEVKPEDGARLAALAREGTHEDDGAPARYPRPLKRAYNTPYAGANLNRVAFPIGGIGAGMFCLEGTGAISHMSVRNRLEFFHEPCLFAALCVKGSSNVARVLEGPVPDWKFFGSPGSGNGSAGVTYGLPRFREAAFVARFPFATVELRDSEIPLLITLTGWSPFVPGEPDESSLPVGAIEYTFANPTKVPIEAVFSFNSKNFMAAPGGRDSIAAFPGGFELRQEGGAPENEGSFAVLVDEPGAIVDHSWFRGGWWDAMTLAWRNVAQGTPVTNPPMAGPCPGASLSVPFTVAPGQTRTIRLMTAWYVPKTNQRQGPDPSDAFAGGPAHGTAAGQSPVTGFLGKGLANTFVPGGDAATGTLTSDEFTLKKDFLHFLIAGGVDPDKTGLQLLVDGKVVRKAAGKQSETLEWASWPVAEWQGKRAQLRIVDKETGGWGHICIDQVIASNQPIEKLRGGKDNALKKRGYTVLADFEGTDFGAWKSEGCSDPAACAGGACGTKTEPAQRFHTPWYAGRFDGLSAVAAYWRDHYEALRAKSALFRDTFYDSTLPPEVIEAVAANLTILKTPTVLRQADGRIWCYEGCGDSGGCCHGSCTHVWNYAQAIAHLFPSLERSLRQTEFEECFFPNGRQAFRSNLPTRPGGIDGEASDGQLGGIMKMFREWRTSGDTEWLRKYWPRVKQSVDYIIATLDPRETGLLEESHHNTYDINYFGPDGHTGSFYMGALAALVRMGKTFGEDMTRYEALLRKGVQRLENELYDGEYFIQKIMKEGLNRPAELLNPGESGPGYQPVIELLNQQGPKYQYGTGCLSDGVLGFWMARMCGLDDAIADEGKVKSHLEAVYRYNLKQDLSGHANPQRPSYAMGNEGGLLLCTWPKGGALAIPFVYSDEVWTGIEYQVASHLMLEGKVKEGLDIVRVCRDRYDGVRRNPFNEYECGHWYARAMSSYGLLQGLTGLRYDAVDRTLHIDSKIGDFRCFLATAAGYGVAGLKDGKPFVEVKSGAIEVAQYMVSGKPVGG